MSRKLSGGSNLKHTLTALAVLTMSTTLAQAGGVERAATNIGFMFEKGNYAELSFGSVSPTVSGTSVSGVASGDMADSYMTYSLAVKTQLSDKLALGLLLDQPIGANVSYGAGTGYALAGSTAELEASALTALLKYQINDNFSVYGGPKIETVSGDVSLYNGLYKMSTSTETDTGFVVGGAYEKPEIALRVALTYTSAITHSFGASETYFGRTGQTSFATEVPQSLALDFQSGVAKDTLVFGSVRWREWSAFDISPTSYLGAARINPSATPLVDYDHDIITYSIGVGRKFTENWSGAITLGHEKTHGTQVGNLGPTDGYTSLGLGGSYTKNNMKISGGVTYAWIGDAKTKLLNSSFTDNHTVGVGVKVGFTF